VLTTILAYLLVALFVGILEGRGRIGLEAKSLDKGPPDRGSTNLISIAFLFSSLSLLAAPLLNYFQIGTLTFSAVVGWLGILVACLGFALRGWAFKTLGRFYTRTLRISGYQHIVQQGPYRVIRHPGYLGIILIWLGAALATTNWIAVGIVAIVLFAAYYYRIQAEETMLMSASNQEYGEYRAHTWKLIPFLY
jgi:protein-S-isoprenylcysteine O-methyltransferase Ste14